MSAELINAWIIIFRGYTGPQLVCEQARLTRWLANPYDAQSQGSKSYQRARESIVLQLSALQRVLNEQSGVPNIGIMDASDGIWGGQGISVGANGYPDSTGW
jgi:hypothetical protein